MDDFTMLHLSDYQICEQVSKSDGSWNFLNVTAPMKSLLPASESAKTAEIWFFLWQQQNVPPLTSTDPSKAADCMIHQGRTEGGVCVLRLAAGYKHDRLTSVCSRLAICMSAAAASAWNSTSDRKSKGKKAGDEQKARSEGSEGLLYHMDKTQGGWWWIEQKERQSIIELKLFRCCSWFRLRKEFK